MVIYLHRNISKYRCKGCVAHVHKSTSVKSAEGLEVNKCKLHPIPFQASHIYFVLSLVQHIRFIWHVLLHNKLFYIASLVFNLSVLKFSLNK